MEFKTECDMVLPKRERLELLVVDRYRWGIRSPAE